MLGGKESHNTMCCFSLIYWHSHFGFFFHATKAKKDNLPQLAFELGYILTFSFSLFSLCYIHSSAADSISTSLSLPLTTLITYYTSVYSLYGIFPPLFSSPAVPHQVSLLLQLHLACAKSSSVPLVIVNYKMVVMPEAPQSKEKEASEM